MNISNNSIFLKALNLEETKHPPVWLMRQAGRYLPEYQKLRKEAGSFLNLCRNPELAAQVTIQPITRFGFDAAIIFSDILVIPDALGLGLKFVEGEGPRFEKVLQDEEIITNLGDLDINDLSYQQETIKLVKKQIPETPIIGFTGGPFTLACYMIEGKGDGEFLQMRKLLNSRPDLFKQIIITNIIAITKTLVAQAKAGADALMIFDSWAGLVPEKLSKQLLINPVRAVIKGLEAEGIDLPVIVFFRNSDGATMFGASTGASCMAVDWRIDLSALSEMIGDQVALQGNLDPAVLLTNPQTVKDRVNEIIQTYSTHTGHIFNLGHGIHKDTPIDNVHALIEAVRKAQ